MRLQERQRPADHQSQDPEHSRRQLSFGTIGPPRLRDKQEREMPMAAKSLTRRTIPATAAASAAATLPSPFVRGAFAAGKLSIGAWDHWVPGTGTLLDDICRTWTEKEKVDLTFDLITSNRDKDLMTLMAEGQAKAGHDIMGL